VKIFAFEPTREIMRFDSHGATVGGVALARGEVRVSLLQLAAGGVVGAHPAVGPQLLLVVAGSGWVRSGDETPTSLAAGEAAFWQDGEVHESRTDLGLTAVIVEADAIEPLARPRL
jgi:quercetin dioxygenase-like cupin family protein